MNCEQAEIAIQGLPKFSRGGPSLHRIAALLERAGKPHAKGHFVHVAGTNGKGSTASMVAKALTLSGYKTGLYLSPAVIDFRERIQVDGQMIPREALAAQTEQLLPWAQKLEDVNQSEFLTALAFVWFREKGCEIAVLEAGLGGQYDATNVIDKPEVSVLTAVGLDHTAILGDTLAKIAEEKCGILKPDCPVVTCPGQAQEALTVIRAKAQEKGCPLHQVAAEDLQLLRTTLQGTEFAVQKVPFRTGLLGAFQAENACTAQTACRVLQEKGWHKLTEDTIRQGLEQARIPARMELLGEKPLMLLDGAHNPQGAQALSQSLSALTHGMPLVAVIGVMSDKDSTHLLQALAPHLSAVFCVSLQTPRALPRDVLVRQVESVGLPAFSADTIADALDKSRQWAIHHNGGVIWCGSLYLAAELHQFLSEHEDWR